MQYYSIITIIAVITIVVISTCDAATYEFRLGETTSSYKPVELKTSSGSWKSACYESIGSTQAKSMCYGMGYAYVSSASYSSSTSTGASVGYNVHSCSTIYSESSFSASSSIADKCTVTSSLSGCYYGSSSSRRLTLSCSGTKTGGNIGTLVSGSDGSDRYFRLYGSSRLLQSRSPHSTSWTGVCGTGMSTTTAGAVCGWFGWTYSSGGHAAYTASTSTSVSHTLSCTSTSSDLSSSCTFSGTSSCSASNSAGLRCRSSSSTYGSLNGNALLYMSSYKSYLRYKPVIPCTSSSCSWGWGKICTNVSSTTAGKLCDWVGRKSSTMSSYSYGYYYVSSSYKSMTYISCSSTAKYLHACSYSTTSSCSSYSTLGLNCGYSSSSSSKSSSSANVGAIIGGTVGGIFGFIFLVGVCVAIASASKSSSSSTPSSGSATITQTSASRKSASSEAPKWDETPAAGGAAVVGGGAAGAWGGSAPPPPAPGGWGEAPSAPMYPGYGGAPPPPGYGSPPPPGAPGAMDPSMYPPPGTYPPQGGAYPGYDPNMAAGPPPPVAFGGGRV